MSHFQQMRAPERDQTETSDALREFQVFFERYPNSPLTPEVRTKWREARDRLSQRRISRGFPLLPRRAGVPAPFRASAAVLKDDPEFTGRDEVYFYLAECLARTDKKPEAIPLFERLLDEFSQSEHVEEARRSASKN